MVVKLVHQTSKGAVSKETCFGLMSADHWSNNRVRQDRKKYMKFAKKNVHHFFPVIIRTYYQRKYQLVTEAASCQISIIFSVTVK